MRLKKRSALSLMIGLALAISLGYATTTLAAVGTVCVRAGPAVVQRDDGGR